MKFPGFFRRTNSGPTAGNRTHSTNTNNTNLSEHQSRLKSSPSGANPCAGGHSTQSQKSLKWRPSWPFDLTSFKQTYIQKKGSVFTPNEPSMPPPSETAR